MTTIQDVTAPELIRLDLHSTDTAGAIEELAGLMEAQGRLTDLGSFVETVLAREEETGGTGMESGIAIPHGKSSAVSRATVAVGRSDHGVDFGAEDGTPADLIFLIAAPEGQDDLHVTLLSRLARKLIHADFRTALREAETPQAVFEILEREVQL